MLRKVACAAVLIVLSVTFVAAEELKGRITKVEDGKITFQVGKFAKGEKPVYEEAKTYEVAKDVKVMKREGKDKKSDIADGLKAETFTKIDKEGVRATINVVDGKVTEVTTGGGKGKGKTTN